jgi:uncharacterized protein YkwD
MKRKQVSNIIVLCLLICSCESIKATFPFLSKEPEPEQITVIKEKWKENKPGFASQPFSEKPSVVKPYSAGSLTQNYLNDGLNTLNFVRFLAGLSENVVMDNDLNIVAQHGAVLLAKTGFLSHTPSRPSDMDQAFFKIGYESTSTANIYQFIGKTSNLSEAVKSWCDDSDESNIDRVGHRCWILKPKFGKTGFGYATTGSGENIKTFSTIQVFDQSATNVTTPDYILWPNKGYFPSSFFSPQQAWSVHLSSEKYNFSRCRPTVKLTNVSKGTEWVFSVSDKNKSGKYFNINSIHEINFGGYSYVIIFRPDNISSFLFDKKFKVEIGGLVDKSGRTQTIEYEVEFFTLL